MPSSTNPQVEEAVDHAEAARTMVENVIDGPLDPRNPGTVAYLIGAQVHASLAIAQELRTLNETLGGVLGGGTDKFLKVRNG